MSKNPQHVEILLEILVKKHALSLKLGVISPPSNLKGSDREGLNLDRGLKAQAHEEPMLVYVQLIQAIKDSKWSLWHFKNNQARLRVLFLNYRDDEIK